MKKEKKRVLTTAFGFKCPGLPQGCACGDVCRCGWDNGDRILILCVCGRTGDSGVHVSPFLKVVGVDPSVRKDLEEERVWNGCGGTPTQRRCANPLLQLCKLGLKKVWTRHDRVAISAR